MKDGATRDLGRRALMMAVCAAVILFIVPAVMLICQNTAVSRRMSGIVMADARITAELRQVCRDINRVHAVCTSGRIAAMSSQLTYANFLDRAKANYYAALIFGYALRNELDPFLVYSVIQTESSFLTTAVSPKGARGLMQVLPLWTSLFHIDTDALFHPPTNIHVGTSILRDELKRYGSFSRALAAYNSGKPYGQERYVNRVLGTYAVFAKRGDRRTH